MKIGIITYCHCLNYGAELQSYAMINVLNNLGYDAEIINFDRVPLTSAQTSYLRKRAILQRFKKIVYLVY